MYYYWTCGIIAYASDEIPSLDNKDHTCYDKNIYHQMASSNMKRWFLASFEHLRDFKIIFNFFYWPVENYVNGGGGAVDVHKLRFFFFCCPSSSIPSTYLGYLPTYSGKHLWNKHPPPGIGKNRHFLLWTWRLGALVPWNAFENDITWELAKNQSNNIVPNSSIMHPSAQW